MSVDLVMLSWEWPEVVVRHWRQSVAIVPIVTINEAHLFKNEIV